ncbi:FCD domain-containing protein [Streptomyces sp. KL116D]|uniref:FCD domain-containing protein n=1 Tax=Streptomyces sp. KL116D TaxID=3045152 RepID=UPI00355671D7
MPDGARGLCAAKAAVDATDAQLDELTELGRAMSKAVADGDPITYSELNHDLHARIRDVSGQQHGRRSPGAAQRPTARHRFQLALRPGRPQQSSG